MIDRQYIINELGGLYGNSVLQDIGEIIRLYDFYEGKGQHWPVASNLDYKPTQCISNYAKKLIKKEAGFMFGRAPEITINPIDGDIEMVKDIQTYIDDVLTQNNFSGKLLLAGRDCFIGKRVAIKLTGQTGGKIGIQFRPACEFVFSTEEDNVDFLTKIIFFYRTDNHEDNAAKQRIWRQKYEIVDGRCLLTEGVYNGYGDCIEKRLEEADTGLDFIPCYVIINDGLTGDLIGESDVAEIMDLQTSYNRLISDDIDALKFNMFPQRVAIDANAESLQNMKIAPGALIDLQSDADTADIGGKADMKMLESNFTYAAHFENFVNIIKNDMYSLLNVPNVGLEQLKGLMQSGKSMRALYWELISRCEEKWKAWEPGLIWLVESVLKMTATYKIKALPDVPHTVHIEKLYTILEDDADEKQLDLSEVNNQVRSRKSYIDKWDIASDSESELEQIKSEKTLFEDSFDTALNKELNGNEQ